MPAASPGAQGSPSWLWALRKPCQAVLRRAGVLNSSCVPGRIPGTWEGTRQAEASSGFLAWDQVLLEAGGVLGECSTE